MPQLAFAQPGAWLLEEGEGQLINNFNYYRAAEFVNSAGNKTAVELFEKYEFNPYVEYGYSNDLTIGGSLAANSSYNYNSSDDASYSADHAMIFIRSYLYNNDGFVISLEPSFAVNFKTEDDLNPKKQSLAPQLKINYGYTGADYYAESSILYSLKSGGADDKIKADIALGIDVLEDIIFLNQLLAEHMASSDYANLANYNLYKAQTSFVWDYNEDYSHQLGLSYDIAGKNTGLGYGIFYSLWYKF